MKKKLAVVAIAAAVVLSLAAVLRRGKAETPVPAARKRPAVEKRAAYLPVEDASPAAAVERASAAGDRRRYRVAYEYSVAADAGFGRNGLVLRADGELLVRVYEPGLEGLCFAPLAVEARTAAGETMDGFDAIGGELHAEVLVRRDARGRALSLRFDPAAGPEARNFLKGLVAALEVVGSEGPADRWAARGSDTTGRYVADYAVVSRDADGVRLSRRKTYEELFVSGLPPSDGRPFDVENGGETAIRLDPSGALVSIEGRETIALRGRAGELAVDVRAESSVRVILLDAAARDAAVLAVSDHARRRESALAGHGSFAPEGTRIARTPVQVGAVAEILSGLAKTKEWTKEAPHAFLALREMLAESAECRAAAQALLRAGTHPPEALQVLADALGSTRDGWRELLPLAAEGSVMAVGALGLAPDAPDEVLRCLSVKAREAGTSEVAIDALGLAGGLPANESRRDAVGEELLSLLGGERDVQVLGALGNAASPKTLGAILERTGSPDEVVRAAAAYALRKFPSKEAFEAAIKLASDPSAAVRESAVAALVRRSDDSVRPVLEKAAKQDPHEDVRAEALRWFAARGDRDILAHAAANDPSPTVRGFARSVLEQ